MYREKMFLDCPEGFEDRLTEIIDDIEDSVKDIKDLLDIKGIDDLGDIVAAYDKILDLATSLY